MKETKKESIAKKQADLFYNDAYTPSLHTKENPDGILVIDYQGNNSENYLFVDGSVLSVGGDYREMSQVVEPNKPLSLSLDKRENGEYQLMVIDNRYGEELNTSDIDYSKRVTSLNSNGSSYLHMSDEQGFNDSIPQDKYDTKELFEKTFGLDVESITSGLEQKTKQDLKSDTPSVLNFLSSLLKREGKENKEDKVVDVKSKNKSKLS